VNKKLKTKMVGKKSQTHLLGHVCQQNRNNHADSLAVAKHAIISGVTLENVEKSRLPEQVRVEHEK
jgi:hypothetical protein